MISIASGKLIDSLKNRVNELEKSNKILHAGLLKNIPPAILMAFKNNEVVKAIAIDNNVSEDTIYLHKKLYNFSLLIS